MNILFICHDFPPHRMAGAQLYVKSLAEAINASGHFKVDVLHPVFRGELEPGAFLKIQQSNLIVFKYGKVRTGNNFLQVRDERILEDIAKFIKQNNYDIIHVHTLAEFTAAALEASIESSKPTIMTAHDQWLICEQWFMIDPTTSRHCGGPTSPEKCADCFLACMGNAPEISKVDLVKYQAMRLHYMKLLAKRLKRLYVPSQSLANDFANFGIPGAKVLPLGLKPSFPLPKKKNRAITFGYLGQIRPAKGLHTLIEAFVKFCSHDVKLEIHGNYEQTPYTAKLLYMSKKHPGIDFCGPFVPEDLPRIYSGLDLMINPSMNESFSITIREAFQHGVPVVASNVGGIPEILNNNHNGFLFPPGDSQYLGKILSHLSKKPSKNYQR
jgi:glycosyltransferase involved in cell wall biosynthesis